MRKIIKTDKIPSGYELFMDVYDNIGRYHKLCACPIQSGSVAYFDNLTQLRKWKYDVEEIRTLQEGGQTLRKKIMDHVNSGEMNFDDAKKMFICMR